MNVISQSGVISTLLFQYYDMLFIFDFVAMCDVLIILFHQIMWLVTSETC